MGQKVSREVGADSCGYGINWRIEFGGLPSAGRRSFNARLPNWENVMAYTSLTLRNNPLAPPAPAPGSWAPAVPSRSIHAKTRCSRWHMAGSGSPRRPHAGALNEQGDQPVPGRSVTDHRAGRRCRDRPMGLPAGAPAYFSWGRCRRWCNRRCAPRLGCNWPWFSPDRTVLLGLRAVGRLAAGLADLALPTAALNAPVQGLPRPRRHELRRLQRVFRARCSSSTDFPRLWRGG